MVFDCMYRSVPANYNTSKDKFAKYCVNIITYLGGIQREYKFPNGYGASCICNSGSYGGYEGLWEIAVIDSYGDITYDTDITDDVIGYLTEEQVQETLENIMKLTNTESKEDIKMKDNEIPYIDMVALLEFVRKQLPNVSDRIVQNVTNEMLYKANNYIYNITEAPISRVRY